mgnify:CR=1 FL=1
MQEAAVRRLSAYSPSEAHTNTHTRLKPCLRRGMCPDALRPQLLSTAPRPTQLAPRSQMPGRACCHPRHADTRGAVHQQVRFLACPPEQAFTLHAILLPANPQLPPPCPPALPPWSKLLPRCLAPQCAPVDPRHSEQRQRVCLPQRTPKVDGPQGQRAAGGRAGLVASNEHLQGAHKREGNEPAGVRWCTSDVQDGDLAHARPPAASHSGCGAVPAPPRWACDPICLKGGRWSTGALCRKTSPSGL